MQIDPFFLFSCLNMLGGACASFSRSHIECGILDSFVKGEKCSKVLAIIKMVLSLLVCSIIIIWTNDFLKYCFKTNKLSVVLGIPWVIANVALMAGFVFMMFFTIIEIIERVCEFIKSEFVVNEEVTT